MPKAYWIARVDIRDPEGYKDYVAAAKLAFDRFGAKFLARGGASDAVEGPGWARNVIIEFASLKTARDCSHFARNISTLLPSGRDMPMAKSSWSREWTISQSNSLLPAGYSIRRRRLEDDPQLLQVENRAAELFRQHRFGAVSEFPTPHVESLQRMIGGRDVSVAVSEPDDDPVNSPLPARVDYMHLAELSVDPAHGQRGLGNALVSKLIEQAAKMSAKGVSLTTFRDVPFNAPFYAKMGFSEASGPAYLAARVTAELPHGV